MEPAWLRVIPSTKGTEHELVVEWDSDWQDWSVESLGAGRHRLCLIVTKDMIVTARLSLGEEQT